MRIPANAGELSLGPPHSYAAMDLMRTPPHTGIWLVPLDTPTLGRQLLPAQAAEEQPRISPGGKLLAYIGNETGRFEVYIRPLPGPRNRVQVSTNGGDQPLWSRNRQHLFYRGRQFVADASL